MGLFSTMTSDGEVTIPPEILSHHGLKDGDIVEFVLEGRDVLLRAAPAETNVFDQFGGALAAFDTRDEILEWIADLRDDEPRKTKPPST